MAWQKETQGEFKGLHFYKGDPWEDHGGPFYFEQKRGEPVVVRFRAQEHHMNGGGAMHGGCYMTFADSALFAIAWEELEGWHSVTMTMASEFLGPAFVGELMEAKGEVTKAGRSVVFVRGMIYADGRPCFSFSGTIKKTKPYEEDIKTST